MEGLFLLVVGMKLEDTETFVVKARRVSDPSDTLAPELE
jgi:hypothetical protein